MDYEEYKNLVFKKNKRAKEEYDKLESEYEAVKKEIEKTIDDGEA